MIRRQVLKFLEWEIERVKNRLQELAQEKSGAEGPRTAWHDTIHLDIERDIETKQRYLARCQAILASIKDHAPSDEVGSGSIVTLEIDAETATYIVVSADGASVGDYAILSVLSPIGKTIWGKRMDAEVSVITPDGGMQVRILEVE